MLTVTLINNNYDNKNTLLYETKAIESAIIIYNIILIIVVIVPHSHSQANKESNVNEHSVCNTYTISVAKNQNTKKTQVNNIKLA